MHILACKFQPPRLHYNQSDSQLPMSVVCWQRSQHFAGFDFAARGLLAHFGEHSPGLGSSALGALLADMLLVETMVENGLCYWERMQQISSEILCVIRSKYVDLKRYWRFCDVSVE